VGVEEVNWEDISMEEFVMGEENFHKGGPGFTSIISKNKEKLYK